MEIPYPRREEEIQMLVEQSLILLVLQAEVLEELVSQPHQLVHSDILLLYTTLHTIFAVIGGLKSFSWAGALV